ncbi:MAG: rhodanese-like domain-containing protein [Thermoanaerobaculia bacterium]
MPRTHKPLPGVLVALILTVVACGPASGISAEGTVDPRTARITAEALHERLQSQDEKPLVIDVREPHEFEAMRIDGARLAPLGSVVADLEDVDKDREIVLVCRTDNRSGKAQRLLAARGYTRLQKVEGGMVAWEKRGFPVVKGR